MAHPSPEQVRPRCRMRSQWGSHSKRADLGAWSWDLKTDAVTWMGRLAEIHGIETENWSGTFSTFQQVIHPEDQPEVIGAIQESLRSRKPYQVVYRLAPQDGNDDRWIEAMASVVEQGGEVVRLVGICRDVTDRQKLLRELRARAKQQEIVARLGERALTESNLQALFEEIVTTIAEIPRRGVRESPRARARRRRALAPCRPRLAGGRCRHRS